jgi:hypothetical protein
MYKISVHIQMIIIDLLWVLFFYLLSSFQRVFIG